MSLQSIWSCFTGLGSLSRSKQDTEEISFEDLPWQENLDQMINEVLLTEIARLRATFSQHLREHEVALSQLRSDGHARSCTRHDVELLRQQVQLMERHRRRRNFEVKKLRKAMKEVRNALFSETPPAAQGHLAAKQLLDEVRNERERRLAEKRYLEDQIKKLSDEVEEQQNAAPLVDHEKEKLKASVRQLKLSIESKDRYACWVCNRASHERQESGSDTEDSDRHEDECVMMRRRLVEMEEEIRLLTGGTAGSGLADFQSAAPSQASSQKPSARLSLEPPSIAESPLSLRPFRERVPTPWAEAGTTSVAEASVQFMDSITTVTSQDAAGEAVLDARTVSFRPAAEISLVEFDHGAASDEDVTVKRKLPLKSVRDRQQTSWVPSLPSDEKSVRFKDLPTSPLGKRTGSPDLPSASKSDSQTADANTASTKSRGSEGGRGRGSEDDPPSDAETVSSASSRNPRSRMTTPFMSAVDWGYEVSAPKEATQAGAAAGAVAAGAAGDSVPSSNRRRRSKPSSLEPYSSATDRNLVKQVSIESSIEREITERVKLNAQRQAREERLVQVGSADANVPLALERCSSADGGGPEADLANHIVADAVKDTELLRNTLRNLAFFETFDDDALHCLIEAMEVYEFQHSEKVVRQGDTDGTHFFVVAQGEFCVLKDNNPHCYIGPGASFGESVLLLFGERNATVCARGCARAYGMEGMQVRELLSKQYEQMRRSVVEATDEVLKSNLCQILSGLNGYELQSLYDQVEMRSFDEGDTILSEGESPKEVLILYSGQVESWKDAQDVEAVPRFHLMGDYALPFKDEVLFEQPTNLRAATPVEVLVLKRSLLDNIFGDQLQQVLVKHRVLHVLAKHQDFSRLHQEHREAIAGSCQIRCLGEGSEQSWEDVRMIVALNGEIELRLEAGPQHLIGAVSDLFAIPYEQQKTSLQLKALGDSKLAVWQREDLGSILAFDDFDGALEQDNKVRSLRSVFIFATLSKQQLQRLANALQIQIVRSGKRVFSQGDQGTHFYIIRKGAVSVEIDGRMKRRLGDPDYFGERALLGSEIRSASITALEDTELWKMGKETFQEMMQGPCLDYLKDRISLQDTNLTFQDLEFVRVIGRGGFGVVKMVRAKKTGVRYALKCVRKRDVVEKNVQDALVSELSILKEVDHPFIIKFVRSFRNESRVYFLMELVSGGELLDALDALGLLKYSQALFYTGCIVLALEFLHSRRIAYLDLKSENCLIDQQGYLKMIDFGIARRITNTRYGPLKGTPMFMAPEMILGKGHTTVADLWSLGICLYEFVIGHFPFASNCSNHGQIFHQILRAELRFPEWFDKQPMADEIISLIRGLLTRDPKKRLGAGHEGYTKLKAHPFFKHLCWEKLLGREQEPPFAPTSETYAEDKERSAGLQAVGDSLPTVEEEEVRCAASEDPWEDPAPGWDADF